MDTKPISLESEAGFRVLFECATLSILVISERGVVELCNPCSESLFGYGAAELIGKPIEVLIPENLRKQHEGHRRGYFGRPKARPMGVGMELYARKKDGSVFPVEISLGHYELEGDKLAVAFVTDITSQVRAKQLIAEREAWFRNMADNSPVMIWVSDAEGRCTYFNNTWLEFTGRKLQEELGTGWLQGVHLSDVENCLEVYQRACSEREAFSVEYRLRRRDGHYRWINHVGKPTFSDQQFSGFIGSCSDIHDQRMMKEELAHQVAQRTTELHDALGREREMSELKSRFVSMASHEFRTPLSIVLSSTTLIEQYGAVERDPRIEKHIARIKNSVGNLTGILNDFLSLDKLEQGKVEVEIDIFDLADFLKDAVEDVQLLRKKGQNILITHVGPKNVMLDQKKLRYVLVNLLSNSVKYSPENASVDVFSELKDDKLTIEVRDKGIGIPESEHKHLFNKFFRANNVGNIQGTGLGLTIVKRYVELMGGEVTFRSELGKGTTFIVDLPQKP